MKVKILSLTVFFLSAFGTIYGQYCTSDARYTEAPYFDSAEISVASNVVFGSAPDHLGAAYSLKMDIYYPNLTIDPSPKRPFVMLFHGGGFTSGDKQSGDIKDLCIHMARRGFVCATVNYRLGYDFTEYGQYKARYRAIQDGHAAMRHVVNNAAAIRVDTNWLFVGGQSAGALLALGMVYADSSELDSVSLLYHSTPASTELGNLYTSGNSLTNTYSIKGIFNNWGAVTKSEIDVEEMLPTIAFHGDQDTVVRIDGDASFLHYILDGSRAIHNQLTAHSVCSEITVDLTAEHGIFRNASSEFRAGRASCFFKSVFCNTCSDLYTTDSIAPNCSLPAYVGEPEKENTISIYPNPTDDMVYISGMSGEWDVVIHDIVGQLVYTAHIREGKFRANLVPGIYVLTIQQAASNKQFTTRMVKN